MRENVFEIIHQIALLAVYGALTLVTGAVGLIIEYHSYLQLTAGEYQMAAWMAVFGAVALYFGYLLFSQKFLPTVRPA